MKIVALLGSPRTNKNSASIANRFITSAAQGGAETLTYELNKLVYRGCQGCYACKTTHESCVIKDDLTQVLEAVKQADLVLLASPVYYGEVTAQMKGFIDRTFSYLKPDYISNVQPSRLSDKKLVFVLTQGHPDEALFNDIFPRYSSFLNWLGFTDTRLIRACGIGPSTVDAVPESILVKTDEVARELVGA